MQVKPPPRRLHYYTNEITNHTPPIHYFSRKKKTNRVMSFLQKFNPSKWFNEFRDIEITLEEFAPKKK